MVFWRDQSCQWSGRLALVFACFVVPVAHAGSALMKHHMHLYDDTIQLLTVAEEMHTSRIRRSSPQMSPEAKCSLKCLTQLAEIIKHVNGADMLLNPVNGESMLNSICFKYHQMVACYNKCGDFDGKQQTMKMFHSLKFMCVDRYEDFRRHMTCYELTDKPIQDRCTPVCGGNDYIGSWKKEFSVMSQANDIHGMLSNIDAFCLYIVCYLNCIRPVTKEICGTVDPAKLLEEQLALTVDLMDTMLIEQSGGKVSMPENCDALAKQQINPDDPRLANIPLLPSSDQDRASNVEQYQQQQLLPITTTQPQPQIPQIIDTFPTDKSEKLTEKRRDPDPAVVEQNLQPQNSQQQQQDIEQPQQQQHQEQQTPMARPPPPTVEGNGAEPVRVEWPGEPKSQSNQVNKINTALNGRSVPSIYTFAFLILLSINFVVG